MATATGGKNRKYARNKVSCAVYRSEGRREKNRAIKQKRHVVRMLKQVRKQQRRGLPLGVEVFCLLDYVKGHSQHDSLAIEAQARLDYVANRVKDEATDKGAV